MDKKLYWASIALAILGVAVSIYMTIYKLTLNNAMCLGSGQCEKVNNSKYSEVYGFPVAGVGVIGYLAIVGSLALEKRGGSFFEDNATLITFGMSLTGFAFTLYLIYVEIALIKALCPFCVTSQVAMSILFVISIIRLVRQLSD
jgi:uncharacterized membrane protein